MTSALSRSLLAAALLLALPLSSSAAAPASEALRAEFAAAYAAPTADASSDSDSLRAYPLYPWLSAAQARVALADGSPESLAAARALLAEAGDVASVRDLRRAVLTLAAERGDGALFLAEWRDSASNEALACQKLEARRSSGDTATLADEIAARWLKEAALPEACNSALSWLKTQPLYTPALIERRLRARLLDADAARARPLLAEIPPERRGRYEAWLRQLGNPAGEFALLARGTPQLLDSEGLGDSWSRWARRSAPQAAALLPALISAQKLSLTQGQSLQGDTALALAWSRDPGTLALFKQVPERLLDERGHEWRIRAALWAGDWDQALNWLVALPEPLASQPRWRYWTARALEAVGQKGEAQQRYTSLALEHDPYGLFAAARIRKGWTPIDEPRPVTLEQALALDAAPAIQRAREAWRAGFKSIASLEWRDAIQTLPASVQPALVREAAALGWHDQALVTATRLGIFRDLEALFPRPHAELVEQAAKDSGIPAQWLYGVMRKESAFKPDATSSAGALGLLQMMPGTAAMTARAAGQPAPSDDDLKNPAINVPLGALHLREVLDKSDGRWQMALAAYNAGYRAVERWRPPAAMDADIWIENIPYNETRSYVQRIYFHVGVYQWLAAQKPVFANNWLQPVAPAPLAAP